MINAVYRLIAPRMIDVTYREISRENKVLVRPLFLSVCRADLRYYLGQRSQEAMRKKLPMALIHECVGQVVFDDTGTFSPGQIVIPIPNTPTQEDDVIAENYRTSSYFASSGHDGFLRDYIDISPRQLVPVADSLPLQIASFTELVSVSRHALTRFDAFAHTRRDDIGVWGDGNVGFITALLLKTLYPASRLHIFGVVEEKMNYFTFADEIHHVDTVAPDVMVDHAFECVGGAATQAVIDQMIDHVRPQATLALLGVAENPVPINTRMVLEKGLRLYGSSRSGRADFEATLALYQEHPAVVGYLENLIGDCIPVHTIPELHTAFQADAGRGFGKTIIDWQK